jgi:hypothetical protein
MSASLSNLFQLTETSKQQKQANDESNNPLVEQAQSFSKNQGKKQAAQPRINLVEKQAATMRINHGKQQKASRLTCVATNGTSKK